MGRLARRGRWLAEVLTSRQLGAGDVSLNNRQAWLDVYETTLRSARVDSPPVANQLPSRASADEVEVENIDRDR